MKTWAPHITQIRWATPQDNIRTSAAAVYRSTGVVILNPMYRGVFSREKWYFILLHEACHLALRTSNEKAVDALAFYYYAKGGHSLKEAVFSLLHSFGFENQEQIDRVIDQYSRALTFQKNHKRPKRQTIL